MDRYPKLKVMLAHGGGFTPYQAARWEHGWKVRDEAKKNVKTQPKNIAGRFIYDTILHSDQTLEFHDRPGRRRQGACSAATIPTTWRMLDCVQHVRGLKIPDADKTAILSGNFEKVLAGIAKVNVQAKKARACRSRRSAA